MKKRILFTLFCVITLCLLAGIALAGTNPTCSLCGSTEYMVYQYVNTNDSHSYPSENCTWCCTADHSAFGRSGVYYSYYYHNDSESCPYCDSAPFVPSCQAGDYTKHDGLAPTCSVNGYKDYYECNGCHQYFPTSQMDEWTGSMI